MTQAYTYKKKNNHNKNGFYKWQWMDDNGDFHDYDKEISSKIQHTPYKTSFPITIGDHKYQIIRICENSGTQLNIKTNTNRPIRSARVPSKNKRNNQMYNYENSDSKKQFQWQWEDDNGDYQDYEKDISDAIGTLNFNLKTSFKKIINNQSYIITRISLNRGEQLNINTKKKRSIQSRPINKKHTNYKNKNKNSNKKYFNSSNKNNNKNKSSIFPLWFTAKKMKPNQLYTMVDEKEIIKNKHAVKLIADAKISFSKTGSLSKIKNVWIIQNLNIWCNHKSLEDNWTKSKRVKNINVKYLFHGSKKDIIEDKICKTGFNRNFNKRAAYGLGVYFAKDAKYSLNQTYSQYNQKTKSSFLLYCRVICGESCKGNPNDLQPKDKLNGHPHETMVDNELNPSMYVTTYNDQAYPLILFEVSA